MLLRPEQVRVRVRVDVRVPACTWVPMWLNKAYSILPLLMATELLTVDGPHSTNHHPKSQLFLPFFLPFCVYVCKQ